MPEGNSAHILIVDDEESLRQLMGWLLQSSGYACTLAANAAEARQRLSEGQFELMLCDVSMPGESGLDLVRDVLLAYPETAAVMVTALDSPQTANVALENGAYGYITKPFTTNELVINITNALRRRKLEIENRHHRERLEEMVRERTAALEDALKRLESAEQEVRKSREETIHRLARVAESRDRETARHIMRMSRYCELIARRLRLSEERCELIRLASPMHDIGKVGVPDSILLKPARLDAGEREVMRRHAEIGYRILANSSSELLNLAATIALTHHEKVDGSGYPRGLGGERIPLEGRIAAIADAFDAITHRRIYKPAHTIEEAVERMRRDGGKHFDPVLLHLFLESMDEVLKIMKEHPSEIDEYVSEGS